jgi:hypothetical protein
MENKPGDGKTSPFGNGQGATAMAGSGSGNNFVTNPKGSGSAGKGPGGPGGTGSIGDRWASRTQKSGSDPDVNPAEIPDGGPLPFGAATDGKDDPGNPIGQRVETPTKMPFKLDGGG